MRLMTKMQLRMTGDGHEGCAPPPICARRSQSSLTADGRRETGVPGTRRLGALRIRRKDAHRHAGNAAELQWNHGPSAMDTGIIGMKKSTTAPLQWSHDLSAMDTCGQHRRALRSLRGFNGAMTFQPWIRWNRGWIHPTGRSFNGAMTFQPWIPQLRWNSSLRSSRFNGAMTFQPWIQRTLADGVRKLIASMEP